MKKFIIILIAIIIVIVGIFILVDQLQYKSVALTLKGTGYNVEIYDSVSSKKIFDTGTNSSLRLKAGNYYYKPTGPIVDNSQTSFVVTSTDIAITVDPDYSANHLADLAKNETKAINSILQTAYPKVISKYTFKNLNLYKKGEWGAGYLVQIVDPRQDPDIYRFVVHKVNDKWIVAAPPQISISKNDYPDIPLDVLYSVNDSL